MATKEGRMSKLKTFLNLFHCSCKIPHADTDVEMNKRLEKLEDHVKKRASVDGEDEWMLVIRKHDKKECKT